jgi:hypothetical protein
MLNVSFFMKNATFITGSRSLLLVMDDSFQPFATQAACRLQLAGMPPGA